MVNSITFRRGSNERKQNEVDKTSCGVLIDEAVGKQTITKTKRRKNSCNPLSGTTNTKSWCRSFVRPRRLLLPLQLCLLLLRLRLLLLRLLRGLLLLLRSLLLLLLRLLLLLLLRLLLLLLLRSLLLLRLLVATLTTSKTRREGVRRGSFGSQGSFAP